MSYRLSSRAIIGLMSIILFSCGKDSDDKSPPAEAPASDADVRSVQSADGAQGEQGEQGVQGPAGEDGSSAPAIGLFDADGDLVGYKFNDGDPADVFLTSGLRALIDIDSGDAQGPLFNQFCLYLANDCSGTCYVPDSRWFDVLLVDNDGLLLVAARGTADEGAQTFESFAQDDGSCQVSTIGTLESYAATPYSSPGVSLPFNAPLYWGLAN